MGRILDASSRGVFSVAQEIASTPPNTLVAPLNRAVLPGYSRMAHDPAQLRDGYKSMLGLVALVAVPASVGVAALAASDRPGSARLAVASRDSAGGPTRAGGRDTQPDRLDHLGALRHGAAATADTYDRHTGIHSPAGRGGRRHVFRLHRAQRGPTCCIRCSCTCRLVTGSCSAPRPSASRTPPNRFGARCALVQRCGSCSDHWPMPGPCPAAWRRCRRLLALVLLGIAMFTGAVAVLWWFAGRPEGAETALLRRVGPRLRRLTSRGRQ